MVTQKDLDRVVADVDQRLTVAMEANRLQLQEDNKHFLHDLMNQLNQNFSSQLADLRREMQHSLTDIRQEMQQYPQPQNGSPPAGDRSQLIHTQPRRPMDKGSNSQHSLGTKTTY
jgi:predicted DsbA family dithiol-disulfide isomerase